MMHTQQISLFNLNSKSKSNHSSKNQFDLVIEKTENPSIELINPFFFSGLSVFIDLLDESQKKTAEYVLNVTGANIIEVSNQQENIFDADIIVTDKEKYKTQLMINHKNASMYGENQIDPLISFRNQKSQISTSNKKRKSIIINPEQIPWAFIPKRLQDNHKTESNYLAQSINKNWFNEALPPLPPSHPTVSSSIQQPLFSNSFQSSCLPDELKNAKNHRSVLQNIQNNGLQAQIQNTVLNGINNSNLTASTPCPEFNLTGGMIVVADSTKRTAPNYSLINQLPDIRLKPLPDGLHFISPFVNDENISKLYHERTETLIANANLTKDSVVTLDKKVKKRETPKKKKSKDGGRSNAAACRYCGICKKGFVDEEKHRASIEHNQNVRKQFQQVDELIDSFSNFSCM
ncbi:hypothetical protein M9Y10_043296 [Tritrichomonas musculus]|uniref:DBF4-type domain-containing protein n=1 Tax=Tritrichomonas musculus TaxID=1915356 RepID=A0ABR2JZ95_9EUKA